MYPARSYTAVAVDSRNACSFEFLFCTRGFRALPACAIHFVGSLRSFGDALAPNSALAASLFSCLGNSYGITSLAVSCDGARELAGSQGWSSAVPGWVPAPLSG